MTAALNAQLTRRNMAAVTAQLDKLWQQGDPMVLDLAQVTHIDSAGVATLSRFAERARQAHREVQVHNTPEHVARTLKLFQPVPPTPAKATATSQGYLERLGDNIGGMGAVAAEYLLMCSDVVWFFAQSVLGRTRMRWRHMFFEMAAMGSQALGVVGLIAFLVGGTVALQSAAQLRQFGASLFVADLIGVSITRELGPLITAVVVAGRSGSAVAAEIGTMMVTEEVDALRTMGINPTRYLILPKVMAILITQPLLTMLANTLAIGGGFLVAVFYLDVAPSAFVQRLQTALFVKDVGTGLFKSVLFAFLIVTIGALCGLRTRGGADAVGRGTTASVVAAIFAIIVADALCSLAFYFNG